MKKRLLSLLLALLLCVFLLPAAAWAESGSDTVYTVTLLPNGGEGDPIVFRSDEQDEIPFGWEYHEDFGDEDCRFFYYSEQDPWMCFRFDGTFMPDVWYAPAGLRFGGWDLSGNLRSFLALTSEDTEIRAVWIDADSKGFTNVMTPRCVVLGPGGTDVDITIRDQGQDRIYWKGSEDGVTEAGIRINPMQLWFYAGELSDGKGHSLPFRVYASGKFGDGDVWDRNDFLKIANDAAETSGMMFYVDPEDFSAAEPGIYTGDASYLITATDEYRECGWDSLPLILAVPEKDTGSGACRVTLWPGEGGGSPVSYSSAGQAEIPEGRTNAANCQFYTEEGKLFFRLDGGCCPSSFSAPAGCRFWDWDRSGDIELASAETIVTARWEPDPDMLPEARFSLTPSITLRGGETEAAIVAEELIPGRVWNDGENEYCCAYALEFGLISSGELSDGQGHSIWFDAEMPVETQVGRDQSDLFYRRGQCHVARIRLDAAALRAAAPGTYTGYLAYNPYWHYRKGDSEESTVAVSDSELTIPLTLTVPENNDSGYTPSHSSRSGRASSAPAVAMSAEEAPGEAFALKPVDATAAAIRAAETFVDVSADDRFAPAVGWALANGITNGTDETHFSPGAGCTRGQMVTFLWRAAGCPEPQGVGVAFADVDEEDYYYNAVLWAAEQGITKGTGPDSFSPDEPVSCAQTATFLYRAFGVSADDGAVAAGDAAASAESTAGVTDGAADSAGSAVGDETGRAYYEAAVRWAEENGIVLAGDPDSFSVDAGCLRGQLITYLWRACTKN